MADSRVSPRRQRSREQLLGAISEHAPISRVELGRRTGLSRSAITDGVLDLLRAGLVTEVAGGRDGRRGRPSTLLEPATSSGVVAGLDFGHQHLAVAVAQVNGDMLAERRQMVNVDLEPAVALAAASELMESCLQDAGIARADLLGVAVGIPGVLGPDACGPRAPTTLPPWDRVDLRRQLADRFGVSVEVGNDAAMGAEGERRFGAAKGCRDFIYVKASHGIGAGLVLGGESYRGARGNAGEIGHTRVQDNADQCRCGNRGCLETIASITAVREKFARAHVRGSLEQDDASLAAIAGNPIAARIISEAGRSLGHVLATLCNCLNPEAIILGGELASAGDVLLQSVRESVDRYALPDTASALSIRLAGLGLRSEMLGAIAISAQRFGGARGAMPSTTVEAARPHKADGPTARTDLHNA